MREATPISTGKAEIANCLYQFSKENQVILSRRQSAAMADQLLAELRETLIQRGEVRLQGVGVISVIENARVFRTILPTAPGAVTVGRPKVSFKASDTLRTTLAETRAREVMDDIKAQVDSLSQEV